MLIGIQASAGREIKQWDPERFAEVGSVLAREYGATLVMTGTTGERHVTERVKKGVDQSVRTIDMTADLDLLTMAGIIERMALFLTCDTGPMHLASAVGTPTVAIFGPSLPSRYAPLLDQSRVVRVDLPCSPCNQLRRPPARCVGHIPDCLAGIEVGPVLTAARELLQTVPVQD
jgi:ADP-heptose:LPS heptosyltransferase